MNLKYRSVEVLFPPMTDMLAAAAVDAVGLVRMTRPRRTGVCHPGAAAKGGP